MLRGIKTELTADIPVKARDWRNDERVWRWCRQYTLIGPNAQKEWLEKIEKDPTIKMFGIYSPIGSFEPVGVCGLTSIDRVNQSAEFSLYIAPEHQRKGFARDALTTLLRHGFNDMNLNRIWGETYDGNHALEMFLKLGMVHEGTSKKAYFRNGKFIDSHRVAILREMFNGPAFVDVKSSVHRFDTLSSVVSVPAFTV